MRRPRSPRPKRQARQCCGRTRCYYREPVQSALAASGEQHLTFLCIVLPSALWTAEVKPDRRGDLPAGAPSRPRLSAGPGHGTGRPCRCGAKSNTTHEHGRADAHPPPRPRLVPVQYMPTVVLRPAQSMPTVVLRPAQSWQWGFSRKSRNSLFAGGGPGRGSVINSQNSDYSGMFIRDSPRTAILVAVRVPAV